MVKQSINWILALFVSLCRHSEKKKVPMLGTQEHMIGPRSPLYSASLSLDVYDFAQKLVSNWDCVMTTWSDMCCCTELFHKLAKGLFKVLQSLETNQWILVSEQSLIHQETLRVTRKRKLLKQVIFKDFIFVWAALHNSKFPNVPRMHNLVQVCVCTLCPMLQAGLQSSTIHGPTV